MRIKFEKGMTPERIAEAFVRFVRENNLVIGDVNIYIQTYDEQMRPEKFNRDEYIVCSPVSEKVINEYLEDVARIRRKRMRVVNGQLNRVRIIRQLEEKKKEGKTLEEVIEELKRELFSKKSD